MNIEHELQVTDDDATIWSELRARGLADEARRLIAADPRRNFSLVAHATRPLHAVGFIWFSHGPRGWVRIAGPVDRVLVAASAATGPIEQASLIHHRQHLH